jgi:hypothetical protein
MDKPEKLLQQCLDDLESRIDPEEEEALLQQWVDFSYDRFDGDVFSPSREKLSPPGVEWPQISVNAALEDPDLMALYQYGDCSAKLAAGAGSLLNVRPNYGSSIIPGLFGLKPFMMPDEANTLPGSVPLNNVDALKRLVDAGVPDLQLGYAPQALDMGQRYQEIARSYPKIGHYVHIYHPDFQGPMDICEIVWGSQVFYAFYDAPDLVKSFLELITETYVKFMRAWINVIPFRPGGNAHWGLYHRGNIMLRDDSAMNLSPAMVDEFVRPYDQRLLDEFGGGALHFCGRGHHYIPSMSEMSGLHAVNLTQPEYNDMETIFRHTVDKGIKLIGLPPEAAETAVRAGRNLCGQVHAGLADQRRLCP